MLADGKIFEFELDGELALFLLERGGAGVLTGAGLEGNDDFILRFGEGRDGDKTKRECGDRIAHKVDLQSTSYFENTEVFGRVARSCGICR